MTEIRPVHRATCHCGAVELVLTLPNGVDPYSIEDVPILDGVHHPSDD